MKALIFSVFVFFTTPGNAALKLDPPDVFIKKASLDRQALLDAVLSLETQLPEMRDPRTFESYFFLCDQLQVKATEFGLDDLYPDAVKSLGKKMSEFGIKWINLSLINQENLQYYLKWMDTEGLSNLLSFANYYAKKITEMPLLKHFSENIDYIILSTAQLTKDRFDIEVGFRDLSTSIAVKFLLQMNLDDSEKAFWASKIYTTYGLNLYTDQVQQQIYALTNKNKETIPEIFKSLDLCLQIADRLIDAPTSSNYDRVGDLFIETVKKSFELNQKFVLEKLESLVNRLSPKSLQSFSLYLISTNEEHILRNSSLFVKTGYLLLKKLEKEGLQTDYTQLQLFLSRIAASVRLDEVNAEGTYSLTDKNGNIWKLTLLRTSPLYLIAALADDNKNIFRTFYSVRYSADEDKFTAFSAANESEGNSSAENNSVVTFKIDAQQRISFNDIYGADIFKNMMGAMTEPAPVQNFSRKLTSTRSEVYEGEVYFTQSEQPTRVKLSIESDGITTYARMRDQYGIFYDFNQGFFNEDHEFSLTTGKIPQTSWVQLRGSYNEDEIHSQIILGGYGFITKPFILKRTK